MIIVRSVKGLVVIS